MFKNYGYKLEENTNVNLYDGEKNDVFFYFCQINSRVMNRKKIFNIGAHILVCLFFTYWFSTNSFIRPFAINNSYKEIVSALLLLLVIYLNYILLTPYFFKKSNYKSYIFFSLLSISVISIIELLLLKSDILGCLAQMLSFNIDKYLFNILFVIFLRNAGFYLFFTVLKLYQQTKANALIEKQEALKDVGLILLQPLRGNPVSININFVSYFSKHKNHTFIHGIVGKPIPIYSTLSYIQEYLDDFCLRINKENIITFTNIISYNEESVIVADGKTKSKKTLSFSKKNAKEIVYILRSKISKLEEKNIIDSTKIKNGKVNDDKKHEIGNVKTEILEEIKKNPGINALKLFENFHNKTTLRTIRRRLKELKDAGKIEHKGSDKTGGYYPI